MQRATKKRQNSYEGTAMAPPSNPSIFLLPYRYSRVLLHDFAYAARAAPAKALTSTGETENLAEREN